MAKLKTLRPLVGVMKSLIATQHETRDTAAANRNTVYWRQWYKSAQWQRLRIEANPRSVHRSGRRRCGP